MGIADRLLTLTYCEHNRTVFEFVSLGDWHHRLQTSHLRSSNSLQGENSFDQGLNDENVAV